MTFPLLYPEHSHHLKRRPCTHLAVTPQPSPPNPQQPLVCFCLCRLFWALNKNGATQCPSFQLASRLSTLLSRLVHAVAHVSTSQLPRGEQPSVHKPASFLLSQSAGIRLLPPPGHLRNAAVNICGKCFFPVLWGIFLAVQLWGCMATPRLTLGELPNFFHRGCTVFHFHQQWKGVPVSPHLCQHLSYFFF